LKDLQSTKINLKGNFCMCADGFKVFWCPYPIDKKIKIRRFCLLL
jgi:hypothetical protein